MSLVNHFYGIAAELIEEYNIGRYTLCRITRAYIVCMVGGRRKEVAASCVVYIYTFIYTYDIIIPWYMTYSWYNKRRCAMRERERERSLRRVREIAVLRPAALQHQQPIIRGTS